MSAGTDRPPKSVAYSGVKPDLPGSEGIPAGYFNYPPDPPAIVSGDVGTGSTITALLEGAPVAVPKDKNSWLQSLDKLTNSTLDVTSVAGADYADKLQVTIAGSNLPDLIQFPPTTPDLPQILDKYCVDLSDYIGGDKVSSYPALQALPPTAWTAGLVNGHLYGISQPRSKASRTWTARTDIIDQLGLSFDDVTDGKSFLEFCKELTDTKKKRWAFGQDPTLWLVRAVQEMTGGPNQWAVENGKYVRDIETEQYVTALDAVRQLWSAGTIHPDSFSAPSADWWPAGTTVFYIQAFEGWTRQHLATPDIGISAIKPPKWNGGGPARKFLGPGNYIDFVAIKKGDDKRIQEILRVINFLAAPFGTKEYLAVNYGVEGDDYTLKGTDPVPTKDAVNAKSTSLPYVGGTEFSVIYVPGDEDLVKAEHQYLSDVIPTGVVDAHQGKFSATAITKGATEEQKLVDVQNEIIQGRKPMSAFKDAVAAWKTAVGDKIREEYANAG